MQENFERQNYQRTKGALELNILNAELEEKLMKNRLLQGEVKLQDMEIRAREKENGNNEGEAWDG